jgi:hypothetical protein
MKKGSMVKLEVEGHTVYGIILSIVGDTASVSYSDPTTRERELVTRPIELSKLVKIGQP